jgi:hypothetical protein
MQVMMMVMVMQFPQEILAIRVKHIIIHEDEEMNTRHLMDSMSMWTNT